MRIDSGSAVSAIDFEMRTFRAHFGTASHISSDALSILSLLGVDAEADRCGMQISGRALPLPLQHLLGSFRVASNLCNRRNKIAPQSMARTRRIIRTRDWR